MINNSPWLTRENVRLVIFATLLALGITGCGGDSSADSTTNDSSDSSTSITLPSDVFVVATTSSDTEDGLSWDTAFTHIQDAIDAAASSGGEVWVAAGTYTPVSDDDGDTASFSERLQSIEMTENVNIYGGFSGTESTRDERDWQAHETVLSGEIGDSSSELDNSFHVVTGASNAIINGVTISDGNASLRTEDSADENYVDCDATDAMDVEEGREDDELLRILSGYCYNAGAGMINVGQAPTVENVIFENNSASKGGAVYNMVLDAWPMNEDPTGNDAAYFDNVIFQNNYAGGRGGAVNNDLMTSPTFVDVQFISNTTSDKGGALYNDAGCSPYIYNALFVYNQAERGAAIVGDGSSNPVLAYTTFYGNYADDIGGALYQGTYGAEQGLYNEMQLNYSLVLGNLSGSSSSSITSWNDSHLLTDTDSIIEYTDGEHADSTGSYDSFFSLSDNGDGSFDFVSHSTLGWDPERDSSDWETELNALAREHSELYTSLPYDTSCTANTSASDATNWYVYSQASGTGNGTSWENAFTSLASALGAADCYDNIYISGNSSTETIYTPTAEDTLTTREATFVVKTGQQLLGGYCDGSNTIGCDVILSGDLDGDSDWNNGSPTGIDDDAYHVLVGADEALISNIVVEYGNANGSGYHQRGAGLLNYYVSPTVANVNFRYNTAIEGAGMTNYKQSSPILSNLTFSHNQAERGGAILFRDSSEAELSDSLFSNNSSSDRGGAIYIDYGATLAFSNLRFNDNSTQGSGGALYMDDNASQYGSGTNLDLTDSSFENNSAALLGGGAALYNRNTYLSLNGGEFSGNSVNDEGSSIHVGFGATLLTNEDLPTNFDVDPVTTEGTIGVQGDESSILPPPLS